MKKIEIVNTGDVQRYDLESEVKYMRTSVVSIDGRSKEVEVTFSFNKVFGAECRHLNDQQLEELLDRLVLDKAYTEFVQYTPNLGVDE